MAVKLRIEWTEDISYATDIELTDEEIADAAASGYFKDGGTEPDEEGLRAYLDDNDDVWFEQCDTNKDVTQIDSRYLEAVSFIATA